MAGVYTKVDLGWAAGIVDGEGSICLMRTHKNKMTCPQVLVSSTTSEILLRLKTISGGGSICKCKRYQSHHKQAYSWRIERNMALEFIQLIRPYMSEPTKIARSDLLLSDYKKLTSPNGKYSKEQLVARLDLDTKFYLVS